MAKAKKTTDETTPAATEGAEAKKPAAPKKKAAAPKDATAGAAEAAPKAEAKKAPAKKPAAAAAKKPAAAAPGGFGFGIDTNLAAQAAAKMLLNRSAGAPASGTGGGTVKHLKDSLNKPVTDIGGLLGGTSGGAGKASNLPHFSNQQKGQNQATGHVGNTGVPRRTPG